MPRRRILLGPSRQVFPVPVDAGRIRLSQQFAEIVHSGGDNRVRLSQQFAEIVHSGGDNRVRVTQICAEVIHAFGTPPLPDHGKSGGSPGHNKPPTAVAQLLLFKERERYDRNRGEGRFSNPSVVMYGAEYLPPNQVPIRLVDVVKTVRM